MTNQELGNQEGGWASEGGLWVGWILRALNIILEKLQKVSSYRNKFIFILIWCESVRIEYKRLFFIFRKMW